MENENRLMYVGDFLDLFYVASAGQDKTFIKAVEMVVEDTPPVDAVEVAHIEEVKQEILQTLDTLIATHRYISNSRFANSEKYLGIPESSNDYYGIYADVMEVARRLVAAALTNLCESSGSGMRGDQ